jgi:hypothetical protein
MNKTTTAMMTCVAMAGLLNGMAQAGQLDAPAAPTSPDSAMFTLQDVYNRFTTGAMPTNRTGAFAEPSAGPTDGTMHTLTEIVTCGVIPYRTGMTDSYISSDDGDLRCGLAWPVPRFTILTNGTSMTADDTVLDNLTGLMWLRDMNAPDTCGYTNCTTTGTPGVNQNSGLVTWTNAFDFVAQLNAGAFNVNGTNANASYTDWRVPNIYELGSLLNVAFANPNLSNTQGTGKLSAQGDPFFWHYPSYITGLYYWTSTTDASTPGKALQIRFTSGLSGGTSAKTTSDLLKILPVRGGR